MNLGCWEQTSHIKSWCVYFITNWHLHLCLKKYLRKVPQNDSVGFIFQFSRVIQVCYSINNLIQTELYLRRLINKNISTKDAYADFVVRAQEIAIQHSYVPVNW